MRMPFSAPLPVPTMMAVGVARPSAHGQAMTMTAVPASSALTNGVTRGVERRRRRSSGTTNSHTRNVSDRDAHDGRDEHGADAVGEALDRGLGALRVLDELARSAPARCRRRPSSRGT